MSVHWHTLFVMGNSIVLLFTILTSADSVFRTDTWVSVWQLVAEFHEFLIHSSMNTAGKLTFAALPWQEQKWAEGSAAQPSRIGRMGAFTTKE